MVVYIGLDSGKASIQLSSTRPNFLKDIQLMLTTIGIFTNVKLAQETRQVIFREGHNPVTCKDIYVLYITCYDVIKLIELGFSPKRLVISEIDTEQPIRSSSRFIRVVEIIDQGRFSDTYCFTEEKNHTAIFNGVMTGQCEFAILLYSHLQNKLTKERIHEIFREAVEIETQFITESIPCKLIGMNSSLMTRYIKHIASFWMHKLTTSPHNRKCPKLYQVKNPFDFMDMIGIDGKTNFFEQRTTEYKKNTVAPTVKNADTFKNLDDNF